MNEIIQAPYTRGHSIFLEGPAGAGKTTLAVQRLRYLLQAGIPGDTILVLTPQRTLAQPYVEALRAARVEDHRMLEETYHISEEASDAINMAKAGGRTIVAGGTTTVRALESAGRSGRVVPGPGSTSLFITPGYEFKIIDRLLTNFHLPQSTLLMLVSALAGRELILSAYQEAVRERYRFYSYGDCMLIL